MKRERERERIDSPQNPLVKKVRRLGRSRRREASFLIEGGKLVSEALAAGTPLEAVLVASSSRAAESFPDAVEVSRRLFETISTLEAPDGVLAIAQRPSFRLEDLPADSFVVVSAGIQDPGNLGAIARIAEASGASGLALLPGSADAFGPKTVRGSMGSLFRLPVVELDDLAPLRARGFAVAALVPHGGTDYRDCAFARPMAVLLGSEGGGLETERVRLEETDLRVSIPMRGGVESLNVATAAAVVLYEATRRERHRGTILPP